MFVERPISYHNQIRHVGEIESGDIKWFLICEWINGSCIHIWSKAKLQNQAKSIAKWMTMRKDRRTQDMQVVKNFGPNLLLLFNVQTARNVVSWFLGKSLNCCHQMSDFKDKMHQIRFRLGLRPRPRWGAYSAPQTLGIIFDDLEWPPTRVSRSLYTYKSNISKTVHFRDKVTEEH